MLKMTRERTLKTCTKCNEAKPTSEFYRKKESRDGFATECKTCNNKRRRAHIEANSESHKNRMSQYYQDHKEVFLERASQRREEKWKEISEYKKCWAKLNRAKKNADSSRRRARQKQRTPRWLSEDHLKEIENFFWLAKDISKVTGEDYHVDHIVPMKGKNVCGLHVPWNLQVLPSDVNIAKGNKHVT
jgi:hypothetical protein